MPDPIRRSTRRATRWTLLAVAVAIVAALGLAACSGASPTPAPTPKPTPTPVGAPVSNPNEAAALVLALDPRFAGTMEYSPDVIGASKWWTSSVLPGRGYRIEVTIGWGDCPSGCISRHVWTYDVLADGSVTLVDETGDEVPAVLPE